MWGLNGEQEACIAGMEDHYATLRELHKHTWNNYKVKRAEFRELQLEIIRYQEQGRDVSDIPNIEAVDV